MVLITFVCSICGRSESKTPSKKDIVSFGEDAFVLQASGLLPDGWKHVDSKTICPRCLLFKSNFTNEIRCYVCKKVSIQVTENFLQDGLKGLERLSSIYSFKRVGNKFVCSTCSKRVENNREEQNKKNVGKREK